MKPTEFLREFDEKDSGEYNDEAGMAQSNLETIVRSAQELEKHIGQEENLPEWCQEKLAVVKGMLTAVTDYMVSQDSLDDKQDDFAFNTDRIAEQLNSMLEGGPYDLPGIDYDRPGDTPRKPKSHGGTIPRRHNDDPDFMDPDQRRLRADQARVKKAQDEYHAKKKSGMAEGEIEKTPTGIIHRAEKRQASRAPEMDRLDKGTTNNLDKGIGVHWDKTPGRGRHGIIDPTVDEQGVAEAAPSTELQDKMRQVRPKGKGITRTELQNAMRRKGKKQWHCPECATYDDNVHGKFCSKYKPKEQGVAEGYEPPTSAKGSPAYRASLLRKKQERQAAADAKKKQQGVAEGHADQQRKVFKKNGEPVGEVGIDRESSPGNGQWYMKCYANGIDNVGYDSYEEAVAELKHCLKQGVAEAVWDRPSQSYVPRDGRTFGQTNHPREEHCDACGAATGHAGPGEDSNVDDEGNVYCDDCYADQKGVAEGSYDDDKGITHTRGSLVAKLEALPKGSDDFEWNRIQAIHHLKQGNMLRAKYYMALMKRGEQGVAEKITPPGKDDMEQYRKDTADMAKAAIANKTPMSKNQVNEFAGGMGAASVAAAPGVGRGPKVGSLFGGSYAPKTPFNKKRKK